MYKIKRNIPLIIESEVIFNNLGNTDGNGFVLATNGIGKVEYRDLNVDFYTKTEINDIVSDVVSNGGGISNQTSIIQSASFRINGSGEVGSFKISNLNESTDNSFKLLITNVDGDIYKSELSISDITNPSNVDLSNYYTKTETEGIFIRKDINDTVNGILEYRKEIKQVVVNKSETLQYTLSAFTQQSVNQTSNQAPLLDNGGQKIIVQDNTAISISLRVIAKNLNNNYKVFQFDANLQNVAGSLSLIGLIYEEVLHQEASTQLLTVTIVPNNIDKTLDLIVGGTTTTVVNWSATLIITKHIFQ